MDGPARRIDFFKTGEFSFLSHLDLTQASVSIDDDQLVLQHVLVTDKLTQQSRWVNLTLDGHPGLQGLTVSIADIQSF